MRYVIPQERFHGCLLGQAVGDALGAPFEGLPADFVFWHNGPIGEWLASGPDEPLRYTDDTQMMIGVAESLVADGAIRSETLIGRFVANYEERRGYGAGARQILDAAARGEDWNALADTLFPGGSYGNGAAMRVAPIGLVFGHNHERLLDQAATSARPTHHHPLGIEGARLMALAVALAAQGPPLNRKEFYAALSTACREEEFAWQLKAARPLRDHHSLSFLGSSLPAHRSVVTAIACFTANPNSFERCIERAITLGDDTDTVAAMTGALCGAHLGEAAVPSRWIEKLDGERPGVEYLRDLARSLFELHARLFGG